MLHDTCTVMHLQHYGSTLRKALTSISKIMLHTILLRLFTEQFEDMGVGKMNGPAQSPNLNSTEHFGMNWSIEYICIKTVRSSIYKKKKRRKIGNTEKKNLIVIEKSQRFNQHQPKRGKEQKLSTLFGSQGTKQLHLRQKDRLSWIKHCQ